MADYIGARILLAGNKGVVARDEAAALAEIVLLEIRLARIPHAQDAGDVYILGLCPLDRALVGLRIPARVVDVSVARIPAARGHIDPALQGDAPRDCRSSLYGDLLRRRCVFHALARD